MNTIELTDTMDTDSSGNRRTLHSRIPAWFKTLIYIGLGALTYQGALITYEQVKIALIQAKYSYISGVISDELNGKGFDLNPDLRKNEKAIYEDMHEGELRMALWALSAELYQCQLLRSEINSMTTGITLVTNGK